jgi:hypothetical protein
VIVRSFLAAVVMAVMVWMIAFEWLAGPIWFQVLAAVALGPVIYWIFSILFKIEERHTVVDLIFRRSPTGTDLTA